jgi:hypothetical protein
MSSITNHFERALRSVREKSRADIASMIVIFVGVATILILLSPR